MEQNEFSALISNLAGDLKLASPVGAGASFTIKLHNNLSTVLDLVDKQFLLISCAQGCHDKADMGFLWNILQANLLSDANPPIVNAGVQHENLIFCWLRIPLADLDRGQIKFHVERFMSHVTTVNDWIMTVPRRVPAARGALDRILMKGAPV